MPDEPNIQSFNFFAVASYGITVRRFPDLNGLSGLARVLTLTSTKTDSHQGSANIWFDSVYAEGDTTLGIAIVKPPNTSVNVDLPIGEADAWLDILKGNRQVYFAYILQGDVAADGATDVISVTLTTEDDPAIYGRSHTASFARAL